MPRTPGERGNKLLAGAERATNGLSRQMLGRLLLEGREDSRDVTIRRLEVQVEEL